MPKENGSNPSEELSELEWIALKKSISDVADVPETDQQKLARKLKQNPFVPIGCLLTAGVLCFGLRSFMAGDMHRSQRFMRFRVLAQGSTIVALLIPLLYSINSARK